MRIVIAVLPGVSITPALADTRSITANVWADNWFKMSVNDLKILEDSVPITTERSFNAETATFSAGFPMTIAIMAKDFTENDTGLEYIGTRRQQMGDGGMIAQFRDADSGEIVATTNSNMRCLSGGASSAAGALVCGREQPGCRARCLCV